MAAKGLRFVGSSQQQLPAASSFNTNKKYVLNAKNDVVELVDLSNHDHHHHHHHQQNHQQQYHQQQHVFENGSNGYGAGSEARQLTRYNSAPSSLFTELDQIASSSNCSKNNNVIYSGEYPHQQQQQQQQQHQRSPTATTSRFSQSSGLNDASHQAHHPLRGMVHGNDPVTHGFTGLLTGTSSTAAATVHPSMTATLSRQTSLPSSFQQQQRSSEEDSSLLRSPSTEEVGMEISQGTTFWESNNSHPSAAAAAAAYMQHQAAAAAHAHAQQEHHRKRTRDFVDMDLVSDTLDAHHNNNNNNNVHQLTRHLSLPIASRSSMSMGVGASADNLLGDSVPCRLRAKRGCATHPRSIAERVRRTKISERMRKLQELVPNMDKQTNNSDMLDEAVEYLKKLKKQVEELSDCREKCQGLCKASNNHSPS